MAKTITVASYIESIPTPDGYTKAVETGWGDGWGDISKKCWTGEAYTSKCITLINADGTIRITFNVDKQKGKHIWPKGSKVSVAGHTAFKGALGWRSYSRRGIGDSFYHTDKDEQTVAELLAEQIAKAEAGIERSHNLEQVPGIPFSLAKDKRVEVSAKLQSGGSYTFTPAGFGVGMCLSKRRRFRWDNPAPAETAKYFGCKRLYVERIDCD